MKQLLLLAVLLVTGISVNAQSQKSLEEQAKRIEEMVKNGTYSPDSFLIGMPKGDEIETEVSDPLENIQNEDVIRARNDARRKAYDVRKEMLKDKGFDENEARFDSVGIYAVTNGKLEAMKHIEADENRITPNDFASKWLLTYYGKTSKYSFEGGKAHFRIYFTHDPNSISEYYKMFSSDLTIDDFVICKFKVKGNKREFIGAKNRQALIGYTHVKSKADVAKDVTVSVRKVSDNVYDMTVSGAPGEYLLTWNEKKGSSQIVFDFTLK